MQILKAIVDTQRTNTTIGYVNTGDVVKLNLQVISNGEIGDNWVNPVIELHGIKSDKKRVRQTDNIQIVDLANHHLEITLHEQFMTCDGLVRLQLVIKDDGGRISSRRISSSVFYLRVTKSLEMGVMESHDYIQVFDDFDTYMELVKEFEAKMKEDVALLEAEIQKASDLSQSISKNEAERQEAFEMNESNREVQFNQTQQTREDRFNQDQNTRETQFNASQSSQTSTFTINEAERQKGETQRVANENARQTAERNREVRMAELETKTSELIEKADEQVLKVDEFINANTKRLLEEDARKDYMGNECRSIRETMNRNVDYAVKTAIGEFNYLDYEGQHITANNSIEGHVKSAILKGNTLVNLCENSNATKEVGRSTATPAKYSLVFLDKTKDYDVYFDVSESNNDGTLNITIQNWVGGVGVSNSNGRKKVKITSTMIGDNFSGISFYFTSSHYDSGARANVSNIVVVESNSLNIPYFEGMQSVRMPVLTTTGKNLFYIDEKEVSSANGLHQIQNNEVIIENTTYGYYNCSIKNFYLKPNGVYTISYNSEILSGTPYIKVIIMDDKKNTLVDINKGTFTAPSNGKVKINFYSGSSINMGKVRYYNIQIEEGSTATSYEPYKSNILTTNEPVELRGIGKVKDELNLLNGKLTQRIGEITFDGSENWEAHDTTTTNTVRYYLNGAVQNAKPISEDGGVCDKIPYGRIHGVDEVGVTLTKASGHCYLRSTIRDLSEFKTWLQSNPITVQYRLATESVKTVVLSDNVVYSYDEVTHYDGSSEDGSLIPTVAVKVPTDVNAVISSQRATIQEQTEQINTLEKENTLLTEQNEKQDVDIALNQDAINFMLFEVMGLSNDDANKLNPMAIYFANQILKGKLTYTQVIGKYPQFKDNIDSCLSAEGRSDLIVKID